MQHISFLCCFSSSISLRLDSSSVCVSAELKHCPDGAGISIRWSRVRPPDEHRHYTDTCAFFVGPSRRLNPRAAAIDCALCDGCDFSTRGVWSHATRDRLTLTRSRPRHRAQSSSSPTSQTSVAAQPVPPSSTASHSGRS
eukprot:2199763-Prymnesium_polylepis.1